MSHRAVALDARSFQFFQSLLLVFSQQKKLSLLKLCVERQRLLPLFLVTHVIERGGVKYRFLAGFIEFSPAVEEGFRVVPHHRSQDEEGLCGRWGW